MMTGDLRKMYVSTSQVFTCPSLRLAAGLSRTLVLSINDPVNINAVDTLNISNPRAYIKFFDLYFVIGPFDFKKHKNINV